MTGWMVFWAALCLAAGFVAGRMMRLRTPAPKDDTKVYVTKRQAQNAQARQWLNLLSYDGKEQDDDEQ